MKRATLLADLEAGVIGLVFAYEVLAIALRKTRWTDQIPPLTRKITKNEWAEELVLAAFKFHFIGHRTRNGR